MKQMPGKRIFHWRKYRKNDSRGPDLLASITAQERSILETISGFDNDESCNKYNGRIPYLSLFYNLEQIWTPLVHDGRNYLGPIKGYASLLRIKCGQESSRQDMREYLNKIIKNIDNLDSFLSSVSLYRLKGAFKIEKVSLDLLLKETLNFFGFFNRRGIEIEVSNQVKGVFAIRFELLKRMLIHLLRNACESMEQSGKIRLTISGVIPDKGESSKSKRVFIKVTDSGSGMTKDKLQYIHHPFFTTKPGHFGLGLSYVAMGAAIDDVKIDVRSRIDSGTTVSIACDMKGEDLEA